MANVLSKLRAFRKPKQLELEDYLKKLLEKGLNEDGSIKGDPTPMAPPVGYKKAPSMVEIVRDMVRGERLKQEAMQAGYETFEEADDFDVPDEPQHLRSPHEYPEDQPSVRELAAAGKSSLAAKQKPPKEGGGAHKSAPPAPPGAPDPKNPKKPVHDPDSAVISNEWYRDHDLDGETP